MLLFSLHFLGYALSLLAGNATMISEDFNMTEVFTVLTEVIRDNFRNAKLKQHILPALGEFLFYAATQEENLGDSIPQWDVPGEAKQIYVCKRAMQELSYTVIFKFFKLPWEEQIGSNYREL